MALAAPGLVCNVSGSNGLAARRSSPTASFSGRHSLTHSHSHSHAMRQRSRWYVLRAATHEKEKEREQKQEQADSSDVDSVTRKFGLEAGLWKIFTSKDQDKPGEENKGKKQSQAKELLARYGGAYLATSVSLSLLSFSLCYVLVNAGVDVATLLSQVGIQADATGEKVGTFALAYAAHKAASPIRFPPTVALTPIVAGWFDRKSKSDTPQPHQSSAEKH